MAENNDFLILDGHSLAYRAFHALPVENFATSSGQHTNAVYGFMSMLIGVLKERQPSHIAVAFDLSRDTFRSRRYPEYKAGRAKTPPEFKGQVEIIKQILEALNIPVLTAEGFEADDILSTLSQAVDVPVHIVSGDRDCFQLVNERVTVLYPKKGMSDLALMTPEAITEKYGVPPGRYRDLAALVGETSDNLPGIPGVGPKTAAKWIVQHGSLEGVLANQAEISGKVGEALREHAAQVQENYELNLLVPDAPVATSLDLYARHEYDAAKIHEIFDGLEFASLRPRLLQAWPSGSPHSEQEIAEAVSVSTFEVISSMVDSTGLTKWLKTHPKDAIAVAFGGTWGRGAGSISAVALVAQDGSSVWSPFEAAQPALIDWLQGDQPKLIHDAKGVFGALESAGIRVQGLQMDTAIAAYVLSPGGRDFELADLAQRYLKKSLDVEGAKESAQLSLDGSSEVSGDALAQAARATLDLADFFSAELAAKGGAQLLTDVEVPLVSMLSRMEVTGIAVDRAALEKLETTFDDDANAAVKQAHTSVGHEFNLGSPKQLQEVLFEERGLPKTKKIKTGFTTDAESLQGLLAKFPDDELLVALLRYREVTKLRQTITGLIASIGPDGRIHTTFNQMVAATGRLSSTDPNLQNIPVRTHEGVQIRDTFIVGDGFETLLTADYSQIELRVMAHVSQDKGLIDALKSGEDLHTTVGAQVFGVDTKDVNGDMRRQIKAMSYGLAYGLSAYGLAQQLGISNGDAQGLMNTYFERFGGIRDYLANVVAQARKVGYTESIMGRRRYLPDLNSDNRQLRDMAERMALNAPIQGSAADIVKVAMLNVGKALDEGAFASRVLLQVHDELVVEVAPGELERVTDLVKFQMENAVELSVPMDVSVGTGHSWAQAAH